MVYQPERVVRQMKAFYFAATLLLVASGTWAEMDGNRLLESLQAAVRVNSGTFSASDSSLGFRGMGYVEGVVDSSASFGWCIPAGVKYGQFFLITEKYLSEHPERLQKPAWVLVEEAMIQAFPCQKTGNKSSPYFDITPDTQLIESAPAAAGR